MAYFVYQFEAVSIQEYILSSSKLKEMVGASQLLEVLTDKVLDEALNVLGLAVVDIHSLNCLELCQEQIIFPRKSGGVFLAVMEEGEFAQQFVKLWPLIVQQAVPGLKFSVASYIHADIKKAIMELRRILDTEKNTPKITLPEITPMTLRSPRTGGAVVTTKTEHKRSISIDLPTQIKIKTQNFTDSIFKDVSKKWLPQGATYEFPNVLDHTKVSENETQFPFSTNEGDHTVAIVHADGNGVGQYIRDFFDTLKQDNISEIEFIKAYAAFSQGMEQATQKSAQEAMAWLIEQVPKGALPIRPLILSGDDVTCIIHSDYAFEFMHKLTLAFEQASELELDKISPQIARAKFPKKLTMTTGMAFLRSNQPFYMGYQLAESLCDHSKSKGRSLRNSEETMIPSTLTFVHTTSNLFEGADEVIATELTTANGLKLTNEVYGFGAQEIEGLVNFGALEKIAACFSEYALKVGFLRELVTALQVDVQHAQRMIKRWKEVAIEKNLQQFEAELISNFSSLKSIDDLTSKSNPLCDVLAYIGLEKGAISND